MTTSRKIGISRLFSISGVTEETLRSSSRSILAEEGLLLSAIGELVDECSLSESELKDTSIIVGIDKAIDTVKEAYFKAVIEDGPLGASPLLFPYTSANVLAARATIRYGIKGSAITLASGPLSFLMATSYTYRLVASGSVRRAIAAGVTEGATAAVLVGMDRAECMLTDAVESMTEAAETGLPVQSMADSFMLFEQELKNSASRDVRFIGMNGHAVGIGLSFISGAESKEDVFA